VDNKRENTHASGFVKQAAILGGASLFVRLLGFFYRIPLTALIGDEGNGYYNSAYYIYTLALTLTSVFMIATISRLTSERITQGQYRNAHTLFRTAMGFSVIMGAVGSLVMFFGAEYFVLFFSEAGPLANFFIFPAGAVYAVKAVAPAVFIVSLLTVFRGYFQGMKTSMPTAISQVVEQIFNVAFSLWLAYLFYDAASANWEQYSAAGAAGGTAIAALAALGVVAFIYLMVSRALKKRAADDKTEFEEKRGAQLAAIIRTAFPMVIGLAIFSLASILDVGMANSRILISEMFMKDQINIMVGQFTGKFVLLTTLPVSLSMALSSAVIPEITSSHVSTDEKSIRQKTNLALRLSMMISIPSAVGLAILADPILEMLFPLYKDGGELLRFGSVCIIFMSIVHVTTGVLQGCGHVKLPVIGVLIGVAIKIPLNFFLMPIPEINIMGAVISTVACYVVAAIINLFFLKKYTGISPDFIPTFLKPLLASAGMGFVCFSVYNLMSFISGNAVSTLAALTSGFITYVLLMALIRGFGKRELDALPIPAMVKRLLKF
jgi:stage V sporulation protein B